MKGAAGSPKVTPDQDNGPLGATAFIIADGADCHFQPSFESAVRVIPPYGTEVSIVRDEGNWLLIKFCGKEAWSPRGNLSATLGPMRPAADGEPKRHLPVRFTFNPPEISAARKWTPQVEYGPRGGRFVRTAKGFRRYF